MRSRWPPAFSIRLDCQPAACCQARRQVRGPGAASALEAGPAWARDVAPDWVPAPAAELAVAFTAPGGAVSAPRLIKEVRPRYTSEALASRIQGTVVLEVIVTGNGCASQIRIVRSLDAGGLDEEAVAAVAQWRFEPGRLGAAPVDVLVTIVLDFTIR